MGISRRNLLIGAASSPLAFGTLPFGKTSKPVKNLIFCVADGMADQIPAMADVYLQLTEGRRSYWTQLMAQEYAHSALQATRSLNSVVTDSSAASSSWGSGRHIWNGQLNCYPDKTMLAPIARLVQDKGVRTGLVTTTTITHATPAGFGVAVLLRDWEPIIAEEYLKSSIDVLMGGGDKFFAPGKRKDKRDLYADFSKAGYQVVKNRAELAAARPTGRILGIFSDSHTPFSVDMAHDEELAKKSPPLSEMVKAALANLKDSPKGFLLQIEGGKVDHAAHANDLAGAIFDQIEFELAVKAAVEFALADGETLVIITSDHATGGPSLNGDGDEYGDSTAGLLSLSKMTCSYGPLNSAFGEKPDGAKVREVVSEKLGIDLNPEEADGIAAGIDKKSPLKVAKFYNWANGTLAAILGNYSRVTWTSGNHTAEHVWVTAVGPRSEEIRGVVTNVQFHEFIKSCWDIRHEQPPQMTLEAATPLYHKLMEELKEKDKLQAIHWHDDSCGCI